MFSDDDRAIFEVELSEGDIRHFDPLEIQDRLIAFCPIGFNRALQKHWEATVALEKGIATENGTILPLTSDAQAGAEKQRADMEIALVEVARKAFGFEAVDQKSGDGIPFSVVLSVLWAFCEWRSQKKSNMTA